MILVCGATGRVGLEVVRELRGAGEPVRCLVRDPDRARAVLGAGVEFASGAFDDRPALDIAVRGVSRVFVMSPVDANLAAHQAHVVEAAAAAGVRRIVKLSGSSWTMQPGRTTSTGAAHAQVEAAITATGIGHSFVRPNAFLPGMLARIPEQLAKGDSFSLAFGAARVAFVDVRDIAAVVAHALIATEPLGPLLQLTGPQAWSGDEIARAASAATGRSIIHQSIPVEAALAAARARGESGYMLRHLREVLELMEQGAAAETTDTVERECGRPAGSVDAWLREALVPPPKGQVS